MSDLKKYFDEEMRYLGESGKSFARDFPEVGRMLNLESVEDRDPYIERLFEGFAFLTARIREQLDDDGAGFAEQLLQMVSPESCVPFPSSCLVAFLPNDGNVADSHLLGSGAVFSSGSGQKHPIRFAPAKRFVHMHPWSVQDARVIEQGIGGDILELAVQFSFAAPPEVVPEELPIYLDADPVVAWSLQYLMTREVHRVEGVLENGQRVALRVRALGSMASDDLLPVVGGQGTARQSLRDFFCFDENFRFVVLEGIQPLFSKSNALHRLQFHFAQGIPRQFKRLVQASLFHINVFPFRNAVLQSLEPIHLNQQHFDYAIIPDAKHELELLQITEVVGRSNADLNKRKEYLPLVDFRMLGVAGVSGHFYQVQTERVRQGIMRARISLASSEGGNVLLEEEYLSLRGICGDGHQAREKVQVGQLDIAPSDFPESYSYKNLTRPTKPAYSSENGSHNWLLLSYLQTNFQGMGSVESLKELLKLLCWDKKSPLVFLIDALVAVSHRPSNQPSIRGILRGIEVELRFQDDKLHAEAYDRLAMYNVFGTLLHRMFSEQVSLNTAVALQMVIEPAKVQLHWKAECGALAVL